MDVYEKITDTIIAQIEAGAGKWQMPWHNAGGDFGALPVNVQGRQYRGVNVILLWGAALDKGYDSNVWGTYKMWSDHGCQVRKGEKSTTVMYMSKIVDKKHKAANPESTDKTFMLAKTFFVFNAAQVDGYKTPATIEQTPIAQRIERAEQFFNSLPATVNHGGNRAFYVPSIDAIQLPNFEAFNSPESYYAVRAHESIHWTGPKSRCDREFGKKYGDEAYAVEELTAELGAAFLCGYLQLSNEPRIDHAQYLTRWLSVLKTDKKAIFAAASKAQAALDYLINNSASNEDDQAEEYALAA